jgi:hypothetical protein
MIAIFRDRSASRLPATGSPMTEKTFTLASLNVKGLKKSTSKPREIKLWLASLPFPAQIVLI